MNWVPYKLRVKAGQIDCMVYIEEFRVASFRLRLKCNNALSWSFFFSVPADTIPGEKEDGGKLFPKWLIAVIAGVAGVFVLAILVLCLCCLKLRRKKANGGKKTPTASYSASILCSLFYDSAWITPL